MELLRTGTVQYAEGDYAVIECKLVDIQVHLPLYGPIQAMMKNIEPDFIEITVSISRQLPWPVALLHYKSHY